MPAVTSSKSSCLSSLAAAAEILRLIMRAVAATRTTHLEQISLYECILCPCPVCMLIARCPVYRSNSCVQVMLALFQWRTVPPTRHAALHRNTKQWASLKNTCVVFYGMVVVASPFVVATPLSLVLVVVGGWCSASRSNA